MPKTLQTIDSGALSGKTYNELTTKHRQWFDKNLFLEADIIKNIDDPKNGEHLKMASEIFWRLQQGEPIPIRLFPEAFCIVGYLEFGSILVASLARINFAVPASPTKVICILPLLPLSFLFCCFSILFSSLTFLASSYQFFDNLNSFDTLFCVLLYGFIEHVDKLLAFLQEF